MGGRADRIAGSNPMDDHKIRVAEALRRLKEEYDREVQRLTEEDPDWVKELLDRFS
jgi:hypothetical protein